MVFNRISLSNVKSDRMVEQNDAIIKQNDRILQIQESCDVIEEVIDKLDSLGLPSMKYLAIKEVLKDPFQQHVFFDRFQDTVKDYIALKMQATLIARSEC